MRKSTLASVESLIPLLKNPAKTLLKTEPIDPVTALLPWRRRSRIRRILNRLRQIERTNSALQIEHYRLKNDIYILVPNQNIILFDLMWPEELPKWHLVTGITIPPFST